MLFIENIICILCISEDEYSMHCVLDLYTLLELIIGVAYTCIHNNIDWNTGNDILHVIHINDNIEMSTHWMLLLVASYK